MILNTPVKASSSIGDSKRTEECQCETKKLNYTNYDKQTTIYIYVGVHNNNS